MSWNLNTFTPALSRYGIESTPAILQSVLDLTPHLQPTQTGLKIQARRISLLLESFCHRELKHTKALEVMAQLHGYPTWHDAQHHLPLRLPDYNPAQGWEVRLPPGHVSYEEVFFFARPEEKEAIPAEMYRAFEDYFNRRLLPKGWARAALEGRVSEAEALAGSNARYVRPLLRLAEYYTWRGAFETPENVSAWLAKPYGDCIPVGGFNIGGILAALFNVAEPCQFGYVNFRPEPMTLTEGADIYLEAEEHRTKSGRANHISFDYLQERRMKLHFDSTGWLNIAHFQEGRLPGIAAYAVDVAREGGPEDVRLLAVRHLSMLHHAAKYHIDLSTPLDDPSLTETGQELSGMLHRSAVYLSEIDTMPAS